MDWYCLETGWILHILLCFWQNKEFKIWGICSYLFTFLLVLFPSRMGDFCLFYANSVKRPILTACCLHLCMLCRQSRILWHLYPKHKLQIIIFFLLVLFYWKWFTCCILIEFILDSPFLLLFWLLKAYKVMQVQGTKRRGRHIKTCKVVVWGFMLGWGAIVITEPRPEDTQCWTPVDDGIMLWLWWWWWFERTQWLDNSNFG